MVMTAIIMLMPQMAMILMMFVNLDIVSKTSRCQSSEDVCYQYILFIIVKVKSIREKIITTTYYVCMSTAFIKGSRTLLDSHIAHSSRLFPTISQSQKEWIENLSLWS